MKRLIVLALAVAVSAASFTADGQSRNENGNDAQPRRERVNRQMMGTQENGQRMTAEERATRRAERMKTELQLTDAQYERVLAMNLDEVRRMGERSEARRAEAEKRREEMRAEREKRDRDMRAVLNDEQWAKFEDMRNRQSSEIGARTNNRFERHGKGEPRHAGMLEKGTRGECPMASGRGECAEMKAQKGECGCPCHAQAETVAKTKKRGNRQ